MEHVRLKHAPRRQDLSSLHAKKLNTPSVVRIYPYCLRRTADPKDGGPRYTRCKAELRSAA